VTTGKHAAAIAHFIVIAWRHATVAGAMSWKSVGHVGWDGVLFSVVAVAASWVIVGRLLRFWVAGLVVFAMAIPTFGVMVNWSPPQPSIPERGSPWKTDDQGYVSSDLCKSCHPSEYASWHDTYHRTMTQVATSSAIAAPLEAASVEGGDRRFSVRVDDGVLVADDIDQFKALDYLQKHGGHVSVRTVNRDRDLDDRSPARQNALCCPSAEGVLCPTRIHPVFPNAFLPSNARAKRFRRGPTRAKNCWNTNTRSSS
jgi:hypothetical protein